MKLSRRGWFVLGATALVLGYAALSISLWAGKDFDDSGPLSLYQPAMQQALPGAITPNEALLACFAERDLEFYRYKVVGAVFEGSPYYVCYEIDKETGGVFLSVLVDAQGNYVNNVGVLKRGGAWPWFGLVKSGFELFLGGIGILLILGLFTLYYFVPRPRAPAEATGIRRQGFLVAMALLPIVGWIALASLPDVSTERKRKAALQAVIGVVAFFLLSITGSAFDLPDLWGLSVMALLLLSFVYGWVGGRLLFAPEGFGAPEGAVYAARTPRRRSASDGATAPASTPTMTPTPSAPPPTSFKLERPGSLPSFSDVGGMSELKSELSETFGLMLAFSGEADAYRITWNGVLLHGPPGVGKTFISRAAAGEFGLNLIHVSTGDLVSAFRGESSRNVEEAFRFAARNVPSILFFDEFDSIAQSREDWPDQEARRTVNQLLTSLEEYRGVRELVVMAATNELEELDPAVIRPGRFDRHIRVDLPDTDGRQAIFAARLKGRPIAKDLDLGALAERSSGLTPAAIGQTVEMAALTAFREAADRGEIVRIHMQHLLDALKARGGRDRPTVEEWSWDKLVLPPDVLDELQEIQIMIEEPEAARRLGIDPPTGVLLTGPPGTGKTTIGKVLAAQARCSFYPVAGADITSKWLGESERNIQRLFRRARENRPSIIFIDEIDAIASRRGEWGSYDRQINELLQEMDGIKGQEGVFVIAATNRPDRLDPALVRGGRLSRTITIPLPDKRARLKMLRKMTERMPTVAVDLESVADGLQGASGADIKAICQQAAVHAMMRLRAAGKAKTPGESVSVRQADFEEALEDHLESRRHQQMETT